MESIKSRMKKEKLQGVFIKALTHPSVILMSKQQGYDFVFYDLEHGMIELSKLHDLILYGNSIGIESFVRVPENSKSWISRVLDCGARAVMVPMVETVEEAKNLVSYSKYPPIGKRSYSGGANTNYLSGNHARNMKEANENIITIAQIETVKGLENLNEIIQLEGIDAIIAGPVDFGISMNVMDNTVHPDLIDGIRKISEYASRYHKGFGIIGNLKTMSYVLDDLDLIVYANDVSSLRAGLEKAHKETDDLLKEYHS